jgi:serine/threonine-protein kinase
MVTGLGAGSVIAGYRVESRIGVGGMAMVFRARDEVLGRTVALKVLAPAVADDDAFRERFIRESRAAAVVDHPHIIPVYGAGEFGGVLYIAMRFVAGGDLRALLQQEGPLPPSRAAFLLSPLASALDAGHAAGLVHRDVKPANVLIDTSPGRPDHLYLSDFGLAKGNASTGLTGTGQFLGTLDYCAPEQIGAKPARPQTDQYALGCVAYTMLTGTVPFPRDEVTALLWAHMSEPPPLVTALRPDLPPAVDLVLARAMAKDPGERYLTCTEFAEAIRAALGVDAYTTPSSAYSAAGTELSSPPSSHFAAAPMAEPTHPPTLAHGADDMAGKTVTRQRFAGPTAPTTGAGRRWRQRGSRWLLVTAAAAVVGLAIGGSALGISLYTQGRYFVAVQNGTVTLFQGVNSKFAGVSLFSPAADPPLRFGQLGSTDQALVAYPMAESSLAAGQSLINRLQAHVGRCRSEWTALVSWQTATSAGLDLGPQPTPTPNSADCAPASAFGIPTGDLPGP